MTAYRFRWVLLVLALTCLFAGLWWTAGPLLSGDHDEGSVRIAPLVFLPTPWLAAFLGIDSEFQDYRVQLALFLGLLLLTQWMFLRPRRGWKVLLSETARPMKTAVAAAAFMAMMLSFGAIAVSMELFGVWDDVAGDEEWAKLLVGAVVVLWLLWTIVFFVYWRKGTRFQQLRTMARGLIVGSILELFVAVGVFVWKPDSDDCWCLRGSYTGLVFSATVMIWAFGPGLLFLFMREARYHREESG